MIRQALQGWKTSRGERLDATTLQYYSYLATQTSVSNLKTTEKMVYLDTMEEWQRQATQLFQARPATVRKSTSHRLRRAHG